MAERALRVGGSIHWGSKAIRHEVEKTPNRGSGWCPRESGSKGLQVLGSRIQTMKRTWGAFRKTREELLGWGGGGK